MNDRDCDNCAHHSEGGCSVWECSFAQKDDTISRQAAIDALHMHLMYRMGTDSNKKRLDDWINGLPSAQPNLQPTCNQLATDCISRQAAIDTSLEFFVEFLGGAFDENLQKKLIERINALPPAQPEQHWIPCSERLPEKDEQVFVYLFDDSPYIAWICGGRWHTEEFTLDKDEEPVAWMPLPALYEERWEE